MQAATEELNALNFSGEEASTSSREAAAAYLSVNTAIEQRCQLETTVKKSLRKADHTSGSVKVGQ